MAVQLDASAIAARPAHSHCIRPPKEAKRAMSWDHTPTRHIFVGWAKSGRFQHFANKRCPTGQLSQWEKLQTTRIITLEFLTIAVKSKICTSTIYLLCTYYTTLTKREEKTKTKFTLSMKPQYYC